MSCSARVGFGALLLLVTGCAEAAGLGEDGTGGGPIDETGPTSSGTTKSSTASAMMGTTSSSSTGTSASSTSSTSASTSTTTSTGGQVCDGTLDCATCQNCAVSGPCVNQYTACINDPQCIGLNDCLNTCNPADQSCLDACAASYPQGAGLLQAAASCVFCSACYSDCDGASIGCP